MKVKGKVGVSGSSNVIYNEEELQKAWAKFTQSKTRIPVYINFTDEVAGYLIPELCSYDPPGVSVVAVLKKQPKGMGVEIESIGSETEPDGNMLVNKMLIKRISTTDKPAKGQECEKVD